MDVPSKTSLPPAVLTMNGGDFAFVKFLHLGRIYRTPKMGLLLARFFFYPVGVDASATRLCGGLRLSREGRDFLLCA